LAFAALTTVLLSPHLVVYDLVLLLPAVLYLLERQDTPTVRVALFFLFVITWMAPVGHLVAGIAPWPFSVVGAGWGAVPILVLWVSGFLIQAQRRGRLTDRRPFPW